MLHEYNLRSLLRVLFRHKGKFFLVFTLVLAFGVFYVSRLKPTFQAHGSLLVKFGEDAVPDLNRASSGGGGGASQTEHDEVIESNAKILQSIGLLTDVVTRVGVYAFYPDLQKQPVDANTATQMAVDRLGKDLKIWTDSKSNIIDVEVKNADPVLAQQFAATLMNQFIVRQSQVYGAPHTRFLTQQISDARAELGAAQSAFQSFRQRLGISDLGEEMSQLLQEKRDLSGLSFQSATQAQNDLAKLQSDRAAAVATYNASSPVVQRIDQNIATAQAEVSARQFGSGSTSAGLPQKLGSINARISFLEANRSKYDDLKQRVSMEEDKYKNYLEHGSDAHVDEMLNQQNITRIAIVDQPVVPARALPGRRKIFAIAFLLTALLAGLGTVFGFEVINDKVDDPYDITRGTGLPVLATFDKRERKKS